MSCRSPAGSSWRHRARAPTDKLGSEIESVRESGIQVKVDGEWTPTVNRFIRASTCLGEIGVCFCGLISTENVCRSEFCDVIISTWSIAQMPFVVDIG